MSDVVKLSLPGVEKSWRYGLAYWTGTLGNLLTTHRLRAAGTRRYVADVDISDRLVARWHRLFDVGPQDADAVPFLYNQSVGTLLYTRLFADLGINFRHLLHVRHEVDHIASVEIFASARRQRLDSGVQRLSRLGDGKALVDLETYIHEASGAPLAVVRDRFLIRELPKADLAELDRDPVAMRDMRTLRRRAAELASGHSGVQCCLLTIARDMGRAYGKVSGDMNPVHTTSLGARLFGVPRPFLQGLGLRSLVVRQLAGMGAPLDHLSLTFASPAYLGQTLSLLRRGEDFEVQDIQRQVIAYGSARTQCPAASASASPSVEAAGVLASC